MNKIILPGIRASDSPIDSNGDSSCCINPIKTTPITYLHRDLYYETDKKELVSSPYEQLFGGPINIGRVFIFLTITTSGDNGTYGMFGIFAEELTGCQELGQNNIDIRNSNGIIQIKSKNGGTFTYFFRVQRIM